MTLLGSLLMLGSILLSIWCYSHKNHTWALLLAWMALFLAMVGGAYAHDPNHQRVDLNQWFDQLRSGKGPCCSNQDGALVNDADWDTVRGDDGHSHYRVRIDDEWYQVSDDAVVTEANKYGPAMVWGYRINGFNVSGDHKYFIRCFMPGVMG
jgi:hypothetical protein